MSRVSRGGHAEEEPGPEADALLDEAQASPVNSEGEILRTVDLHTGQRLREIRNILRINLHRHISFTQNLMPRFLVLNAISVLSHRVSN